MPAAPQEWIGRTETRSDVADANQLAGLAAVLDHEAPPWRAGEVPPLGHWLYFLPRAPQSQIGEDGHPRRGGFLPPVDLPRRMWAGSRVAFGAPIPVGAAIERRSAILDVKARTGASGEMVFVTVRHEVVAEGRVALTEEQDIVYRALGGGAPAAEHPAAPPPGRVVTPDPVLLFRFSALTFNSHRIHYDRDYATKVEGYPGLVVQGPLTAMLLLDAFARARPGAPVSRFSFRARRPLFEGAPVTLVVEPDGEGARLSAFDPEGQVAVSAEVG